MPPGGAVSCPQLPDRPRQHSHPSHRAGPHQRSQRSRPHLPATPQASARAAQSDHHVGTGSRHALQDSRNVRSRAGKRVSSTITRRTSRRAQRSSGPGGVLAMLRLIRGRALGTRTPGNLSSCSALPSLASVILPSVSASPHKRAVVERGGEWYLFSSPITA